MVSRMEEYNPGSNKWTDKSLMPKARWGLATHVIDGKLYAIGGYRAAWVAIYTIVQVYDPVANKWTTKADMPTPRY